MRWRFTCCAIACRPRIRSYRGVHKLPPGSILTVDDNGGEAVVSPYWSLKEVAEAGARDPFRGADGEAVEALESVIDAAVRARLIADVPIGAFLSGGIDSSVVTASMQNGGRERVRTYTVGFETADYDEAKDAAAVARHLGTEHHPHTLTAAEAVAVVPKLGRLFDEPFADSSQIPTYLVAEIARRDVKVVLSGDGGDELFAGYNRHLWCERGGGLGRGQAARVAQRTRPRDDRSRARVVGSPARRLRTGAAPAAALEPCRRQAAQTRERARRRRRARDVPRADRPLA